MLFESVADMRAPVLPVVSTGMFPIGMRDMLVLEIRMEAPIRIEEMVTGTAVE